MAAHPGLNYFAAGHDSGMQVFKMERERHPSVRLGSAIFYVKAKNLFIYDLQSKQKALLSPITVAGNQVLLNLPSNMHYNHFNQAAHDIILNFSQEGGQFVLLSFDRDLGKTRCLNERRQEGVITAFFTSKDRMCILDKEREVYISSFDGGNRKKWPIIKKNLTRIENLYPGPLGKILVHADADCLFMYDLVTRKVLHEVTIADVRRIYWTPQFCHCVVVCKNAIHVLNRSLQLVNSQKETSKLKSGCFDETNSFVYSTGTHIKYIFLEGKTSGTFRSIDQPVYLSFYLRNQIYAITRDGEMEIFPVDNTDYLFKLALHRKNLQEVKEILSKGTLCGRSIVCYLKEQGYAEIALFFEKDQKERFNLALSSGNLQVAFEAAKELNDRDLFPRLSAAAANLGNWEIPEKCYQMMRQFDKLNFHYAATGSVQRLKQMQMVAGNVNDPMLKFNTSLYTANVEERVRTLVEAGQLPLAYLSARAHGLTDMIEFLEQEMADSDQYDHLAVIDEADKFADRGKTLLPLRPMDMQQAPLTVWPMTNLRAQEAERAAHMFERQKGLDTAKADESFFAQADFAGSTNKEVASILDKAEPKAEDKTHAPVDLNEADWGEEDDLGIEDDDVEMPGDDTPIDTDIFVPPAAGADPMLAILRQNPQSAAL